MNFFRDILIAIKDLITRTKGLDDIHDDLVTAQADLDNPSQYKSDATLALQNTISGKHTVPSANASANVDVADVVGNKTDAAFTTVATTRSLMAYLKGLVDQRLTDKEKAFIGKNGQPALNEHFTTVAAGADPDTNYWTVVEDNNANIQILHGVNLICNVLAGTVGANDAIAHTKDKITWWSGGTDVSTLFFRAKFKVTDLTGEFSIGLAESSYAGDVVGTWSNTGTRKAANIYGNNDTIYAHTADGTAEATNISAYISNNTFVEVEIRVTFANTKFYLNGTLRATHSTNQAPSNTYAVNMSCTNANGITTSMSAYFIEVWVE